MNKKHYTYPDKKRVSLRMPIKVYNSIKREAQQHKIKVGKYIRQILTSTQKPILALSEQDKIIRSNAELNIKLDQIRNFPWREAENLNQIARSLNRKRVVTNAEARDTLTVVNKARAEAEHVSEILENMKK